MSDQDKSNDGNLVPTGRSDLTPIGATNPLVSRGLADLAKIKETEQAPAEQILNPTTRVLEIAAGKVSPMSRHPFDVTAPSVYAKYTQLGELMLRAKHLRGAPPGAPMRVSPQESPEPMQSEGEKKARDELGEATNRDMP